MNHFQAAGGMAFTIATLLDAGLLHRDIMTVGGEDLDDYAREPKLRGESWSGRTHHPTPATTHMLRPVIHPFNADGGMRLVQRQSRPRNLQDKRRGPVSLDDRGSGADLL